MAERDEILEVWTELTDQYGIPDDFEQKLKGFRKACDGFDIELVRKVVDDFITGRARREFSMMLPKAFEVGGRLLELSRVKAATKDDKRRAKPHEAAWNKPDKFADRLTLIEDIDSEKWGNLGKSKRLPIGASWSSKRGAVAPKGWTQEDLKNWREGRVTNNG